jgi:glucose-6-phosphate isomerase
MVPGEVLRFGGREVIPVVRRLSEMKPLLYEKSVLGEDRPLYFMYRDLSLSLRDRERIQELGLRYDLTVIPPLRLGPEYVKTAGHYHPKVPGEEVTYPEVYEVLSGKAHYLLQRGRGMGVEEVVWVEAEKGEKVVIPPGYGHVTINPTRQVLKMANWVARDFSSEYGPFRERRGAAYFELVSGWVKNPNYGVVPSLRRVVQKGLTELGLKKGVEMYGLIRKDPQKLRFLTAPQEYGEVFERALSAL